MTTDGLTAPEKEPANRASGNKNFKLIGAAAGVLLLAVLLYVFFGRGVSASEVRQRAEKELALLQPFADVKVDKISVDTGDNAITYTGLTLAYKLEPGLVIKAESAVESGIDDASYRGEPGDVTSIENMVYKNISLLYEGTQIASLAEYSLKDIKLSYRDFLKSLSDNAAQADIKGLHAVFTSLYNKDYHLGRALAKDLKITLPFVNASIQEIQAEDMYLTKYAPGSMTDFQISAMGRKVFGLDKFGYSSALLPAFILDVMRDPDYISNNPEFIDKLRQDPLAVFSPLEIKGLTLDNLLIDVDSTPLSLKKLKSDFSMVEGNVNFTCAIADLLLSRSFILSSSEFEPLSEVVREDLLLSGDLGTTLLAKNDPAQLAMSGSLKEKKLGGVSGNLEMEVSKDSLDVLDLRDYSDEPVEDEQPRIKSAALSVEDRGFIDFLLACKAALDYEDFSYVKRAALEDLKEQKNRYESRGELTQKTLAALISLFENGGTLDISFKPVRPAGMEELGASVDKWSADEYSVTYKPKAN
jgi:hypothetical protein